MEAIVQCNLAIRAPVVFQVIDTHAAQVFRSPASIILVAAGNLRVEAGKIDADFSILAGGHSR